MYVCKKKYHKSLNLCIGFLWVRQYTTHNIMQIIHMKCLSKKITSNIMKLFVWVHKAFTVTEQNRDKWSTHLQRSAIPDDKVHKQQFSFWTCNSEQHQQHLDLTHILMGLCRMTHQLIIWISNPEALFETDKHQVKVRKRKEKKKTE